MSYDCPSCECQYNCGTQSCPTAARISNTNFLYNGFPIGDASNNCARTINEIKSTIASYFDSSAPRPAPKPQPLPTRPVPTKPVPVKPAPIVKPAPVKPAKPAPIKPVPTKPAPKKPAPKPVKPTGKPVKQPSRKPSAAPTKSPTASPTTLSPTASPSEAPSSVPSAEPTQAPPPIGAQCLGTSCGTLEVNIDYPGNDITSNFTSNVQGCCDECSNVEGCVAYSWSSEDGTCYLKSDKSDPVDSPGTYSAVLGTSFCSFIENDVDYFGNDIGYVYFYNTASVEDCCISCRLYTGCKYFTYLPDTKDCWLKSSDAGWRSYDGAVAGSVNLV
jgi:hypothetical protein